jgi:hypothetical protein
MLHIWIDVQCSNICVVECDSQYDKVIVLLRGPKIHERWQKNVKTKINFGMLLCKLKTELTQNVASEPKKPKVEKMY